MTETIGDYRVAKTEHRVYITNEKANQHVSIPTRDWLTMCQPSDVGTLLERNEALRDALTGVLDWAAKMPGFDINDAVRAAQALLEAES